MSWLLTPAVVLAFLGITLYLGIRAGKGRQQSVAEHVVAGRGLPLLLVFFIAVGEIYSSLSSLGHHERHVGSDDGLLDRPQNLAAGQGTELPHASAIPGRIVPEPRATCSG